MNGVRPNILDPPTYSLKTITHLFLATASYLLFHKCVQIKTWIPACARMTRK
jgi:hypothetical protein